MRPVSTPAIPPGTTSASATTTTSAGTTASMRDRLVHAALTVLQRDGAAALTVRNITAEAGCSTTGVYTYFGGKDGLVEAIFVEGFDAFDAALAPWFAAGDIAGAGRVYRRWALANPVQYMVMFGRAVPEYEPSPGARDRALASFFKLAGAIRAAASSDNARSADAGAADQDGDELGDLAYHTFATSHGYVMLELAQMAGATADESNRLYERWLVASPVGRTKQSVPGKNKVV